MISKLINSFEKVAAAKPLTSAELSRRYPEVVGSTIRLRKKVKSARPGTLQEFIDKHNIPDQDIQPSNMISESDKKSPAINKFIRHPAESALTDEGPFGTLNTAHLPRRLLGYHLNQLMQKNREHGSLIKKNPKAFDSFLFDALKQHLPLESRDDLKPPENMTKKDLFDANALRNSVVNTAYKPPGFDMYRSDVTGSTSRWLRDSGFQDAMRDEARAEREMEGDFSEPPPPKLRHRRLVDLTDLPKSRKENSRRKGAIPLRVTREAEQNKPDWGYRVYGDNG